MGMDNVVWGNIAGYFGDFYEFVLNVVWGN